MKANVFPERVNDTLPKIIAEMEESKQKSLKVWVSRLKSLTKNTTSFITQEHGNIKHLMSEVRQTMKERGIESVRVELFLHWSNRNASADYIIEVTLDSSRIIYRKGE